jgi:hypothetical protein
MPRSAGQVTPLQRGNCIGIGSIRRGFGLELCPPAKSGFGQVRYVGYPSEGEVADNPAFREEHCEQLWATSAIALYFDSVGIRPPYGWTY